MTLGNRIHQPVNIPRKLAKLALQQAAFGICLRGQTFAFLMISSHVVGDHVRVTHLRRKAIKDAPFDRIQVEGLWIRARAALRGCGATDADAT